MKESVIYLAKTAKAGGGGGHLPYGNTEPPYAVPPNRLARTLLLRSCLNAVVCSSSGIFRVVHVLVLCGGVLAYMYFRHSRAVEMPLGSVCLYHVIRVR